MRDIWAVIKREYLQRVRTKWFIFGTFVAPLLILAVMILPGFFMARSEAAERVMVVADGTGVLYPLLEDRLGTAGYDVSTREWSDDLVPELSQEVTEGDIGAYLVLDTETLRSGSAELYAEKSVPSLRRELIESAVTRAALEYQLDRDGVDAGELLSGGNLDVRLLSEDSSRVGDPRWVMGYAGAFLMYMLFLLYGMSVMRSTLEEKNNRVVEVVISAMKPWHLMLGKILGVGSVTLTQLAVWIGLGTLSASAGIPMLVAARPEIGTLDGIREMLPGAGLLALFVGFFLFGFFMYSGLFAAVGAMCNSDEEAQQAQMPVTMLVVAGLIVMFPALESPDAPWIVAASFFPPLTPIVMFVRAVAGSVPGWQLALSFVLMGAAVVAIAWVAGRIYKVGILMSGKRPTLPELWRWVRES